MSAEKRKHVVFDAEPTDNASAGMHPDRAAKLQKTESQDLASSSSKPKKKTAAKLRYLKKSRDKRKKREKAKKAAAPKQSKEDDEVEQPSKAPTVAAIATEEDAKEDEEDEEDEEAAKARRKAEKRAKREARRKEADQPRPAPQAAVIEEEDVAFEAPSEPLMASGSRSPSPAPSDHERLATPDIEMDAITAFPLPEGPPKVDPAVLTAQAMPPALRDAKIVREDTRVALDDFTYTRRDWKGKGRAETTGTVSEEMKAKLRAMGVEDLFPVQAALLPELLPMRHLVDPEEILHDFLVSAPTGSGKTLAYAVPLIEVLSKRIVTRLRALIVLPTRDLVLQVRDTLEALAKGTGLKIGTAAGQHSFAHEQNAIVGDQSSNLIGGASAIDILVATPGRLMEHLQGTQNFTLQHLRFLVIDEADRLLTQAFQDWLSQVLRYLKPPTSDLALCPTALARRPDAVAPTWLRGKISFPEPWEGWTPVQSPCQKLLFSATLTTDPSKVAALELRNPEYYLIQTAVSSEQPEALSTHQFAFPAGLSERMVVLPPALKPLNLLHLLHNPVFKIDSALCFAKSVDAAERLVNLVNFFEAAYIGSSKRFTARTYSGELRNSERQRLLNEFREGKINLLVCSDLIARGIDLPSVEHVISYDVPVDARKYVHRVGRTARAGREGVAWSLVEKQEARHFKSMLQSIEHLKAVKKVKIQESDLGELKDSYQIALGRMKELYAKHAS